MSSFLMFILKSTLCISLLYLVFRTLMRKENFFLLNRIVLLAVVACSTIIPFIYLPQIIQPALQDKVIPTFIESENSVNEVSPDEGTSTIDVSFPDKKREPQKVLSVQQLVHYVYLTGVFISFLILIHSIVSVFLLFRKATVQQMDGFQMVIIDKEISTFSFGRFVIISQGDFDAHALTILAHEQAHIRLGHFYDLMLMETAKLLHWFNPVIYWLARDLKEIHEFQADHHTLTSGIDATKYQLLIIQKGVGPQRFALANSFNHCQIKNRITMMNKQKTSKAGLWKVATFLPLLALLLVFCGREGKSVPLEILSSQSQSSPIMGTWRLVSYNYGGGEELNLVSGDSERIKFITETNFTWVQYVGTDRIVINSAGGSYVFSGDSYTESIEFGGKGMASYIGKVQEFNVKIENNKMELSGELSDGLKIKEVWEKYQPSDKTSSIVPSSTKPNKDHMIWLGNDGSVRYENVQTSFDGMAEKVKYGLKENPQLKFNIYIEEGKIDEQVAKMKDILKANGNPNFQFWSFYVENGPENNGTMTSTVHSKTMNVKW